MLHFGPEQNVSVGAVSHCYTCYHKTKILLHYITLCYIKIIKIVLIVDLFP